MKKYSIIVIVEEKHEDFPQFMKNIYEVFSMRQVPFEILIMAKGTGVFVRNQLEKVKETCRPLKAFDLDGKTTQTICLRVGVNESNGDVIVVCGSYQQITNDSLTRLLDSWDDETDLIIPWRHKRVDPRLNRFQSRLFNALVRGITKTELHDLNCNVKIFRRELFENIELYGNLYRFMPILAKQKGFKVKEVKCRHDQAPETLGRWGLSEHFIRLIDIFTLYFITHFTRKPLRFFSAIGLFFLTMGVLVTLYVFVEKILVGYPIGDRPILLLAIFFMVLGIQAASVGLLGEIIAFTHGRHKKEYTIEKVI